MKNDNHMHEHHHQHEHEGYHTGHEMHKEHGEYKGHDGHKDHDHHSHHAHMVADFKRRFWISLLLTVPVLALAPMIQGLLGLREALRFNGDSYIQWALATIIFFYGGWPFIKGLVNELKKKKSRNDDADSAGYFGGLLL